MRICDFCKASQIYKSITDSGFSLDYCNTCEIKIRALIEWERKNLQNGNWKINFTQ